MIVPQFHLKAATSCQRAGAVLALMALTACGAAGVDNLAPAPTQPTTPPTQSDTCGAGPYARLIGQDATALERELILRQVRIIRPGTAVTQDFRPVRLNFEIDSANQIARIFCG